MLYLVEHGYLLISNIQWEVVIIRLLLLEVNYVRGYFMKCLLNLLVHGAWSIYNLKNK